MQASPAPAKTPYTPKMTSKDLQAFAAGKRKGMPKKRLTMGDMMAAA